MSYDYLIIGAGFAGSVMARQLAEAGQRVLIIDKRDHIAGNAYDHTNEHGVRVHKYGPHIFHTNSDRVFEWLSRFTEWRPYEHRVLARIGDKTVPFPINIDTINQLFGLDLDEQGMHDFLTDEVDACWPIGKPVLTAEDQCLATVGRRLYEIFFKGYTTKMWGCDPSELDKSVTARIPIRYNRDDRYFTDKHQAMPRDGYTAMFERMLDHENIDIVIGTNAASSHPMRFTGPMIWTGPIDEYFGRHLGPLPYRSMKFETSAWGTAPPTYNLPATTVNFPGHDVKPTRVTEWARLSGAPATHSDLTYEIPCAQGEPFYPIPSPESHELYKRYEALADSEPNVTFLGRLGRYQYLNMDQVVAQALAVFEKLKTSKAQVPA